MRGESMHAQRTKKPLTAIGKLIDSRLRALGQNQTWLADRLEISKQALGKWRYGGDSQTAQVRRANAARLADVLRIPIETVHQALGDRLAPGTQGQGISAAGDAAHLNEVETQIALAYRDADPKDRHAVRVILRVDETDPSSDPRYPRGAAPPSARFTKPPR